MYDGINNLSLLDQRKQALLGGVNTNYADIEKQLADQEALYGQQAGTSRTNVGNQLASQRQMAEQQALAQTRTARSTYADLLNQSRRQARSMGGAPSSGAMELYNQNDQKLMQQIGGIGTQRANTETAAQTSADSALRDIQDKLTGYINTINADRRTSLREKQQQISDIEFQAANAANSIRSWIASQYVAPTQYTTQGEIGTGVTTDEFTYDAPVEMLPGMYETRNLNGSVTAYRKDVNGNIVYVNPDGSPLY